MKKILLTTTAIIAIIGFTMMTGIKNNVHAQEVSIGGPMSLELSGSSLTIFGYWTDERNNQTGREFYNDTAINMHVKGTHDEGSLAGLKYGLRVEFDTSSGSDVGFDEVWGYLNHPTFGEIRLGDKDGASHVLPVHLPTSAGVYGLDGYFTLFIGSFPVAFKVPDSGDSTKITYFTPKIVGIQAGLSYTPEQNEGDFVRKEIPSIGSSEIRNNDYVEAGLNYIVDIPVGADTSANFQIGATVSYFIQQVFTPAEGTTPASRATGTSLNYQIGLKASYQGFTFGGGAVLYDDDAPENMGYSAGLGYQNGPVDVNLSFSMVQFDDDDNDSSPMVIIAGMKYTLTPGANIRGEVFYYNRDDEGADNALETGYGAIFGLEFHF